MQRGTKSRPGLVIESDNHLCTTCDRTTRHDRWQGNFTRAVPSSTMPRGFVRRAVRLLGSRDVIELTERPPNQLTVDHKLPQLRWDGAEAVAQQDYSAMSDEDIVDKFQLLKKSNGSVSHNLLKSRACERCYKTGNRGTPFGIRFFYAGDGKWAPADKQDASGCVGCGWFDFDAWRSALNRTLRQGTPGAPARAYGITAMSRHRPSQKSSSNPKTGTTPSRRSRRPHPQLQAAV